MKTILGQGAEATVTLENDVVVKDRTPKRYRHPALDTQLREARTKREAKILVTAGTLVSVPHVLDATTSTIRMEHIAGPQVKEVLEDNIALVDEIGRLLARLHAKQIIHGDLTTSNMILRSHAADSGNETDGRHRAARSDNTQEGHRHVTFASHSSTRGGITPQGATPDASHGKMTLDAHRGDGGGGREKKADTEIVLIDFGLAFTSTRAEDKAKY